MTLSSTVAATGISEEDKAKANRLSAVYIALDVHRIGQQPTTAAELIATANDIFSYIENGNDIYQETDGAEHGES